MKRACAIETQNPRALDLLRITSLTPELLDDPSRPRVIGRQDVRQGGGVVSGAALPRNVTQIRAVVDAEVRERHEILLVDRVPHAELGRDPSVEIPQDVEAVSAFWRGGHAKELSRRYAFQKRLVRWRRGVMELVDDDDIEMRRVESIRVRTRLRLWIDAKTCSNRDGPLSADPELSEARVTKRVRECRAALFEDLLAVRDEEQPVSRQLLAKARVVDCRHDRLACAGCGDKEIAVPSEGARELYLLQQSLLKRHEHDLDRTQPKRLVRLRSASVRRPELVAIKRNEVAARPVPVEDRGHLRDDVGVTNARNSNVPLEPSDHRRVRQVGRSDVRRRVAAPPMKEPGLRMQARRRGVVGDLDVGSKRRQLIECA